LWDLAGELESRSRHPQYAGQESEQDQPEQPSPAAHDADGQQREQRGQRQDLGGLEVHLTLG